MDLVLVPDAFTEWGTRDRLVVEGPDEQRESRATLTERSDRSRYHCSSSYFKYSASFSGAFRPCA